MSITRRASRDMDTARQELLSVAQRCEALLFADPRKDQMFTLKSGRLSPYFFNAGRLNDGEALAALAAGYAHTIKAWGDTYLNENTVLFGPAYKGIPLAAAAAMGLWLHFGLRVPIAFNRKEAKDHGEGGELIGASLKGKEVIIVDDVIIVGTAVRDSQELIKKAGGNLIGVVTILDRKECPDGSTQTAMSQLRTRLYLKTGSILTIDNILERVEHTQPEPVIAAVQAYYALYCVTQSNR